MNLEDIFQTHQQIATSQLNLTPFALKRFISYLVDHGELGTIDRFFRQDLQKYNETLDRLDEMREAMIFYLRFWKEFCARIGSEVPLQLVNCLGLLDILTQIQKIDTLLETYIHSNKKSQLTLFNTYVQKTNPRTIPKKIHAEMRNLLKKLGTLWKTHFKTFAASPPLAILFNPVIKKQLALFLEQKKQAGFKRQYPQLIRQWSIGTLRQKDLTLETRFQQLFGEFGLQQHLDVPYWTHPTLSIMLMLVDDVFRLPFYPNRQIISPLVARRAARPLLLEKIPELDWDNVDVDEKADLLVLRKDHLFLLNLDDYHSAMLATTGLTISQIEYIKSQALIIIFIKEAEMAILVGREKIGGVSA